MRDIVVDLWKTTRFNMGYVGEDEATRLIFQLTTDLMASKTFTIEFNVNGEITVINDISPTDNSIIYVVPEIFTTAEGDIGIQVVGYNDGKVIKSPVVYGRISKSQVGDSGIPLKAYHTHDNKEILDKFGEDEDGQPTYSGQLIGGDITAEDVDYPNSFGEGAPENVKQALDMLMTGVSTTREDVLRLNKSEHTHDNKDTLDKFGESEDGNPTFNGKVLGDGSEKEIFKIPVTITEVEEPADGEQFKVEHTVTLAELEAAIEEGKTPIVLADCDGMTYPLRPTYYYPGVYMFSVMMDTSVIGMVVMWSGDEEVWRFITETLSFNAEDVYYYNRYLNQINSVKGALDKLIPEQVTSGTTITLANNTEYRLRDVTELSIEYPYYNFECWMRLTFASSGNITVTLPANTKYIGTAPDFKNGETWEMSIKDGIVIAGTVE